MKFKTPLATLLFLGVITPTLHPFSVKESAESVYTSVTSWFKPTKKQTTVKEYPIEQGSTIIVKNQKGPIAVRTHAQQTLSLKAQQRGKETELPNTGYSVATDGLTTTITTEVRDERTPAAIGYDLIVPVGTKLNLSTQDGTITVTGTRAGVAAKTESGSITLSDVTGIITAQAPTGSITIDINEPSVDGSLFATAKKSIHITVPKNINASLTAKTTRRFISDIPLTLAPATFIPENQTAWKNLQKNIEATFGSGGMPLTVEASGDIKIMGKTK